MYNEDGESMNKEVMYNNMKKLIESEYYYNLYNRLVYEDDSLTEKENISAQIFNTIIIVCQLICDIDSIKKVVEELLSSYNYTSNGMLQSEPMYIYTYLNILSKYDDAYKINGEEVLKSRLNQGCAIHFTTLKIIEKIKEKGSMVAFDSMFNKDIENKILLAGEEQRKNNPETIETGCYLHQGFGFSKGISMGAQTVGYWMNHTPESLSFLFGGNVFLRDKNGAMEHVRQATSSLDDDKKNEMYVLLSNIWDEYVGSDKQLGCILIDRDALEYETVTYWNEEPPRVVERRPYDYGIEYLAYAEETRYKKDIDIKGLNFLSVPSIMLLEEYRINNIMDEDNRLRVRFNYPNDVDYGDMIDFEEVFKSL